MNGTDWVEVGFLLAAILAGSAGVLFILADKKTPAIVCMAAMALGMFGVGVRVLGRAAMDGRTGTPAASEKVAHHGQNLRG